MEYYEDTEMNEKFKLQEEQGPTKLADEMCKEYSEVIEKYYTQGDDIIFVVTPDISLKYLVGQLRQGIWDLVEFEMPLTIYFEQGVLKEVIYIN